MGKETIKMVSLKAAVFGSWLLTMVVVKTAVAVDCLTVASLISSCSDFVKNGTHPYQGSPCCDAMTTLGYLAYSDYNLRSMCLCFIGIITAYGSRAAIAIGTLPGFCGVSLGFLVDPETDCR